MPKSEAKVKQEVQLRAPQCGMILWRNNVGAAITHDGRPVRYGLANVSAKMNKEVKSSDLIGMKRIIITPEMVGRMIGVFVSIECKKEGWLYTGTEHEQAQRKWLQIVAQNGGLAAFLTDVGDLEKIMVRYHHEKTR